MPRFVTWHPPPRPPRPKPRPDPDIDSEDDIHPLDLFPAKKPLRQRSVVYKRPRQPISSRKPPVPPQLAPSAIVMTEEEQLSEAMLESLSPGSSFMSASLLSSSFLSSEPGSPVRSPIRGGKEGVVGEIERIRAVIKGWDRRLGLLEQRNKETGEMLQKLDERGGKHTGDNPLELPSDKQISSHAADGEG